MIDKKIKREVEMQEVQDELKDKVLEKEYEVSVLQNGIY